MLVEITLSYEKLFENGYLILTFVEIFPYIFVNRSIAHQDEYQSADQTTLFKVQVTRHRSPVNCIRNGEFRIRLGRLVYLYPHG